MAPQALPFVAAPAVSNAPPLVLAAALAAFLASRDAASITGAVIPIDGGWTAQ